MKWFEGKDLWQWFTEREHSGTSFTNFFRRGNAFLCILFSLHESKEGYDMIQDYHSKYQHFPRDGKRRREGAIPSLHLP